jgi:hypothetical protein
MTNKHHRQVFWLADHPTLHTFPFRFNGTVVLMDFVPAYRCGAAPAFKQDSRLIPQREPMTVNLFFKEQYIKLMDI